MCTIGEEDRAGLVFFEVNSGVKLVILFAEDRSDSTFVVIYPRRRADGVPSPVSAHRLSFIIPNAYQE